MPGILDKIQWVEFRNDNGGTAPAWGVMRITGVVVVEAGRVAARVTLADCAKNITCPIYILAGTRDRLTGVDQAQKLAAAVSGPVTLSVIEGGNHVVNNYWYTYRDQTADWMATQLGVPKV